MNKLIAILFAVFFIANVFAQDAYFKQNNNIALFTNPAFAGTSGGIRFLSVYRNQWPDVSGGYRTYGFSYDQYVQKLHGGIGLNLYADNAGNNFKKKAVELIYSLHIPLFNGRLVVKPAISGSYNSREIVFKNLSWGNNYNPTTGQYVSLPPEELNSQVNFFDFSTSVLAYSKRVYGGISLRHITKPNVSFFTNSESNLTVRQTYHLGFILGSDSLGQISFSPNVLLIKQGPSTIPIVGITAKYRIVLLGVNYQINDVIVFATGLQYKKMKLTYSYDYYTTELIRETFGGAHEITFSLILDYKKKSSILTLLPIAF